MLPRTHIPDQTALQGHGRVRRRLAALASAGAVCASLAIAQGADGASTGGTSTAGSDAPEGKAKLVEGRAIPPSDAPRRVLKVIEAANEIRNKPYKYGGGHSRWRDSGYDCSGAVSYALHGGRFLDSPLDSSGLARWGKKGKGDWITVYAHSGHAYAVIAGLRWDTSGGKGPRWHEEGRSAAGYKVRRDKRF